MGQLIGNLKYGEKEEQKTVAVESLELLNNFGLVDEIL